MNAQDFSPSKRSLVRHCARWLMPDVSWIDAEHIEYATGNELHHLIKGFLHRDPEALVMGDKASPMFKHARAWLEERMERGNRFDSEVKVAWNVLTDTARFLSAKGPRDYSEKTNDEKAGTVDLIEYEGGRITVWDWQTTHAGGDPPDKTDQLRTYALWVARVYETNNVGIGELLVTEKGISPSPITWLDAIELDAECDALRAELSQSPEPKPGPHCKDRRCPAIGSCEAMVEHAAELLPADALVKRHAFTAELTNAEHAYAVLVMHDMVKEALAPIRQALEEFANKTGGILSPDGRVWSGAPKSTETAQLDVPGAADLVREMGAGDAIESKVTWTAIERAVGPDKAEQIRAALRASGATKASSYQEFRWRRLKIRGRAA